MMARSIGSIIWASMKGGTKLLAKMYMAVRRARGDVKEGARIFYKTIIEYGLPQDIAKDITASYAEPGLGILKMRNLMKMVNEIER